MNLLFFDTETTGLPFSFNAPVHETENWPRIVQLAWLLTDAEGTVQSKGNHIIKPNGFQIPKGMIHGITTKQALREGVPINAVLSDFLADLHDADAVVCHNFNFDRPIVGAEFIRLCQPDPLQGFRAFCTKNQTPDWARLPKTKKSQRKYRSRFKRPSLAELHQVCMGEPFADAHDALADVYATARCFFHIQKEAPAVFAFPYR